MLLKTIKTRPGSTPLLTLTSQLPLIKYRDLQDYFLVKGRLSLSLGNYARAVESFRTGLEVVIGQPAVSKGERDMHLRYVSAAQLIAAAHFQLRCTWLTQAGPAMQSALDTADRKIRDVTSGEITLMGIAENCLWYAIPSLHDDLRRYVRAGYWPDIRKLPSPTRFRFACPTRKCQPYC